MKETPVRISMAPLGSEPPPDLPSWWPRFSPGELLPWKGVTFRLAEVLPRGLLIEPVAVDTAKLQKKARKR